jgi:hypothetical protein
MSNVLWHWVVDGISLVRSAIDEIFVSNREGDTRNVQCNAEFGYELKLVRLDKIS